MAFCPNCGSKIADGNDFCLFCGTQISSSGPEKGMDAIEATRPVGMSDYEHTQPVYPQAAQQYQQPQQSVQPQQYQQPPQSVQPVKTKNNKPLIIGIISALSVALIICVVIIVVVSGRGKSKDSDEKEVASGNSNKTEATTEATTAATTEATTEATTAATTEATTEATTQATLNTASEARGIIEDILDTPEYMASGFDQVMCCDVNYDGVQEMLVTYKEKHDDGIHVMYELWWLGPNETRLQSYEWLYNEVGGNNGAVGIVEHNGVRKFAVFLSTADGKSYTDYWYFYEWCNGGQDLDTDNELFLAASIDVDDDRENGFFMIGDDAVSVSEYDATINSIQWVYKLEPYSEPTNIDIMSFDYFLSNLN